MLVPRWLVGKSLTLSVRNVSATLARIGLSEGSNDSSVTVISVMRTGMIRFLLQMNSTIGVCAGVISKRPDLGQRLIGADRCGIRIDQRLERVELRLQAEGGGSGELIRVFEAVGSVEFSFHLDGFDWRPFEAEHVQAVPGLAADALDLNERVRVSGLYCIGMMRCTVPLSGSTRTMPPLIGWVSLRAFSEHPLSSYRRRSDVVVRRSTVFFQQIFHPAFDLRYGFSSKRQFDRWKQLIPFQHEDSHGRITASFGNFTRESPCDIRGDIRIVITATGDSHRCRQERRIGRPPAGHPA